MTKYIHTKLRGVYLLNISGVGVWYWTALNLNSKIKFEMSPYPINPPKTITANIYSMTNWYIYIYQAKKMNIGAYPSVKYIGAYASVKVTSDNLNL